MQIGKKLCAHKHNKKENECNCNCVLNLFLKSFTMYCIVLRATIIYERFTHEVFLLRII